MRGDEDTRSGNGATRGQKILVTVIVVAVMGLFFASMISDRIGCNGADSWSDDCGD